MLDLSGLNPPQRDAVLHEEGPLLVLAGAGSGKTRVIIHRIARLIERGVNPDRILGVTFTNKSAKEMQERLKSLVGRTASRVTLSTFHALGLNILREDYAAAGLSVGFSIYDTGDQMGLVRELLRQTKVADRRLDAYKILECILSAKRKRLDEVEFDTGDDYELAAYDLYPRYIEQMRAYNAVDFDDLLLRSMSALEDPGVRDRWSRRYEHMLVDEYQDTSPDQLELLQILAARHGNVCVVGDDDQAIYAWRGAAVDNILSFGKSFPGTREIILDQNYRSTSNILASANAVIKNNAVRKAKVLWSASGDGEPVEVVACYDAEDEAEFVIENIGKLIYEGVKHHDIAILYRSNIQSQIFEETMALERIPFRVVGGQSFFDRKEVRDAVAFLQIAQNPYDEVALRRIINVPPRGIGATSVERLVQYGESTGKGLWHAMVHGGPNVDLPASARAGLQQFVDMFTPIAAELREAKRGSMALKAGELFEKLGLRQSIVDANETANVTAKRIENLDYVQKALDRFEGYSQTMGPALAEFLRVSALTRGDTASDDEDEKLGKVTLMTLHSSKGLEFPYVFLVGVEEELLPHKRTIEMGQDFGEERRLCYVGMTRARRKLWLSHCRHRMKYGKLDDRTPSRFLSEMPGEPVVLRRERGAAPMTVEEEEAKADEFFAKMKAQLGIEG